MEYTALEDFLDRRFGLLTRKGHRDLTALPDELKSHAFFSAKVARAHILERLRRVSDAYSRGQGNLASARAELTDFLRRNGYIPGGIGNPPPGVSPRTWARRKRLSNLASTARLNLILNQNRRMAEAVGQYQRMHDPDVKKFYPCVIYHARHDGRTRGDHAQFDGMIFDKDDPWLLTHTPPWEFNCRCWLENAERPDDPGKVRPFGRPTVDSKSGFVFRPDLAFEADDLGQLEVKERSTVLEEMTALVRQGKLKKCTLLAAEPEPGAAGTHTLSGLDDFVEAIEAMRKDAAAVVRKANLNPDRMPDYKEQAAAFKKAGIAHHESIPDQVKNSFPSSGVPVGTLPDAIRAGLGLQTPVGVRLPVGDSSRGIVHNWRHHKEMFTNSADSASVLKETLGNPKARCVYDVSREKQGVRRLIVIHNPATRAFCVLRLSDDGKTAEIVSWHRENPRYGNRQWSKN